MKIKIAFVTAIIILLTGCVESASVRYGDSGSHYKNGPPPHAPAHGYRHKHRSHDMSYDSGLGAYVVLGKNNYYFDNGLYFRYRNGDWQASINIDSGWHNAGKHIVPKKLWSYKESDRKHYEKREHPGKGNDKSNHKGKKSKWDDD